MAMKKEATFLKARLLAKKSRKPPWKRMKLAESTEINRITKKQWMELSPLSKAAYIGDIKKVNELLRAGANPNVRDSMRRTPLIWAVLGNNRKAAKALLKAGAIFHAIDKEGKAAFDYADEEMKALLIDYDFMFE